jgi:uncharacterized protein (DUF2461 family)
MTASPAPFTGFAPAAIQFLADLAQHNDRAWFQPRKADYERLLKEPLEQLCVALAGEFAARGLPLQADPRRSPFRIYRDTRFSADKAPYKTNIAASFPWVGDGSGDAARPDDLTAATATARPDDLTTLGVAGSNAERPGGPATSAGGAMSRDERHGIGGYLNFRPGEMFVGGGMYMPPKPRLEAFRRAVVDQPDRVAEALDDPAFVAWFGGAHPHETLKRVPAGYPAEHPRADLLRWKDVIFSRLLADEDVCSPDLPRQIADGFAAAMPVFRFLATLG